MSYWYKFRDEDEEEESLIQTPKSEKKTQYFTLFKFIFIFLIVALFLYEFFNTFPHIF